MKKPPKPPTLALARIKTKMVPPPTKADLLRATAQAICDERLNEKAGLEQEIKVLKSEILKAPEVVALFEADLAAATPIYSSDYEFSERGQRNIPYLHVTLKIGGRTPVANKVIAAKLARLEQLQAKHNAIPSVDVACVLTELRRHAADRSHVVNFLLADKDMRSRLAAIGKNLLKALTPAEMASAIPA